MARWRAEDQFNKIVSDVQRQWPQVPRYIIKGVIGSESAYDPKAFREEPKINDASRGLMQLLLKTARSLGFRGDKKALFDPATNIFYGTKLLAQNYQQAGNWPDAVSAYNGGFRPHLAFGAKAGRELQCGGRTVPVGEYCNQTYVDTVLWHAAYFARKEDVPITALPFCGSAESRGKPTTRGGGNVARGRTVVLDSERKPLDMFKGKKGKSGAALLALGSLFGILEAFGISIPQQVTAVIPHVMGIGGALGIWGIRDRQDRG